MALWIYRVKGMKNLYISPKSIDFRNNLCYFIKTETGIDESEESNMNSLKDGNYNAVIEKAVSRHLGREFSVKNITVPSTGAMHQTALLDDGTLRVFVKAGNNSFSADQFRSEAFELEYLSSVAGVRAPKVIDVCFDGDTSLLILEAVKEVKPETKEDFEKLGQGLAEIHRAHADFCGFEIPTYLGVFKQDNTKKSSWCEFFAECRIRDTMNMAVRAGKLHAEQCAEIEKLIARIPDICPEPESFSLLHGDPWLGNLMYDGNGLVAIDCSLYYGNREIDITTVDFFCPVSQYFFDAYNEAYPLEYGFEERRDLWKLNQWLGHVTLFGDRFIPKVMNIVKKYL